MSVKTMSADQLRNDLRSMDLTWPEGIPPQQVDRQRALIGELKRRGEPLEAPAGTLTGAPARPIDKMSDEELTTELLTLSTKNDERSKDRFADLRYAIRQRAKAAEPLELAARVPQVSPRELELPSDDEVTERVVPRRPFVPAPKPQLTAKAPASVRGYTATGREDGSVVLEYEVRQETGSVVLASVLSNSDAISIIDMMTRAQQMAARRAAGE
jgi:hypothetical protein